MTSPVSQAVIEFEDTSNLQPLQTEQSTQQDEQTAWEQWQYYERRNAVSKDLYGEEVGTLQTGLTVRHFKDHLDSQTNFEINKIQTVLQFKTLSKLRQMEKSLHFQERRSDSAASLPSEVGRHYQQAVTEGQAAKASGDMEAFQAVPAAWHTEWRDAIWVAFCGSCLTGFIRLRTLRRNI